MGRERGSEGVNVRGAGFYLKGEKERRERCRERGREIERESKEEREGEEKRRGRGQSKDRLFK